MYLEYACKRFRWKVFDYVYKRFLKVFQKLSEQFFLLRFDVSDAKLVLADGDTY